MMLFEAMPLSLHSNKRKNQHTQEDLPVPKKLAVESQVLAKNGRSALLVDLSDTTIADKLPLPDYLCRVPASPEAERRKASMNAKLALCLQPSDPSAAHVAAHLVSGGNGISPGSSSRFTKGSPELEIPSESEESDDSSMYDAGGSLSGHKSSRNLESSPERQSYDNSRRQPSKDVKKNSGEKSESSSDKMIFDKPFLDYETGGYMRRMASLNASACVTAMMEPEKKFRPHKLSHKSSDKPQAYRRLSSSCNDDPTFHGLTLIGSSPRSRTINNSPSPSRLHNLSASSISSTSEADTSKDSDEILDVNTNPQVYTLIALASLAASGASELDLVPFNTLGLLYNGDTLHPNARAFYISDTNMTLPDRIIPKVVPCRKEFVNSAITNAVALRVVNQKRKRKAAKANNGWMTLGAPIKTIEYENGPNWMVRRYYAGITRNHAKEVIYIRDSVLIRAGDSKEEKPYVAKIASIWQEQPGQLMVTVFWYYRPFELDSIATQGITFQKDELLASQHHDDNSVACIEEKCYILGVSQYCRYQAYTQSKKSKCKQPSVAIIPSTRPSQQDLHPDDQQTRPSKGHTSNQSSHQIDFIRGEDFESLKKVEPELVYLCQRGYNHCSAKLTSKSFFK